MPITGRDYCRSTPELIEKLTPSGKYFNLISFIQKGSRRQGFEGSSEMEKNLKNQFIGESSLQKDTGGNKHLPPLPLESLNPDNQLYPMALTLK